MNMETKYMNDDPVIYHAGFREISGCQNLTISDHNHLVFHPVQYDPISYLIGTYLPTMHTCTRLVQHFLTV